MGYLDAEWLGVHLGIIEYHFGINLGPIVMMIENHLTGLPWQLMRQCPYITMGLRRAGFTNGWL